MSQLNLENQQAAYSKISPIILRLRTEMDKRSVVWGKMSAEQKKKWVLAALNNDKDAVMKIAWQTYKYLRDNFFGDEVNNVD